MLFKRCLISLLLIGLTLNNNTLVCVSAPAVEEESIIQEELITEEVLEIKEPKQFVDYKYIPDIPEKDLQKYIKELKDYKNNLETLYTQTDDVLYEINRIYGIIVFCESDLQDRIAEREKYETRLSEYPEATRVWYYMKDVFGWSNELCAGVMGNIMAEIGGGSPEGAMNFGDKWQVDKSTGLGMFQWTGGRRRLIKEIYGEHPTIEQQLEYMRNELFGINGIGSQVGSNLDKIINANSPEQIAYNFARYFERCNSAYYNARKGYARFAYNYFVD